MRNKDTWPATHPYLHLKHTDGDIKRRIAATSITSPYLHSGIAILTPVASAVSGPYSATIETFTPRSTRRVFFVAL